MELLAGISLAAIEQWGASGYAVTFPIAFNVVYNVLSIPQTTASTSNAYWGRFYITALTKMVSMLAILVLAAIDGLLSVLHSHSGE